MPLKFNSILLICLLMVFYSHVFSQVNQRERIEYDLKEGDDFALYASKKNKKALVVYENPDPADDDKDVVTLHLLDDKLTKTKESTYAVSDNYRFCKDFQTDDFLYRMHFSEKKGTFTVFRISYSNLLVQQKTGDFNTKLSVKEMVCVGDKFFVTAEARKKHVLYVIDVLSGEVTSQLPDEKYKEELVYNDMQVVTAPKGKEVVIRYVEKKGKRFLNSVYFRFDHLGKSLGFPSVVPNPEEDTQLRSGTMTKVSDNKYVIAGTYSKDKRGYANGMYLTILKETGGIQTNLVNFLDIQNFTSYLSERRQERIERKKEKKEAKGKELNLDYNAAVHDVIERENGYLLLCEFYYPTYRTQTYTSIGANGAMTTHTITVFDGFQYTHAAVLSFDNTGKMKWSNAFEMEVTYKPFVVRKFIEANTEGTDIQLTFLSGSSIQLNTFDEYGNSKRPRTIEKIETGEEDDKIKWTSGSDIQYWYSNNFLGFGEQKIKNKEETDRVKRKRKVFFVNRIEFQ